MLGKTSSSTSSPSWEALSEWMSKFGRSWLRCWCEIWPTWNGLRELLSTAWVRAVRAVQQASPWPRSDWNHVLLPESSGAVHFNLVWYSLQITDAYYILFSILYTLRHLEHAQDRDSSNKVDPHDQLAVNLFWHFTVVGQVTQRLCCWLLKGFCKALMWLEAKKKKEQLSMLWFSLGPPRHLQEVASMSHFA